MKRLLLIIVFLLTAGFVAIKWLSPLPAVSPQTNTPQNIPPALSQSKTVPVNGQTMGYALIEAGAEQVFLIPNFFEQITSEQLMGKHECQAGINGGFYDTANRPLGLFAAGGTTLRGISDRTLINGFFGVTKEGLPFVSDEVPTTPTRFVLQTGPLFVSDTRPRTLSIRNDEHARRIIAAVTSDKKIIFIALYLPESVFDGPLLADVPKFITAIGQKESLSFTDAVNLDGGSASAFYNQTAALSELTPIGSFFCVKS